MDRGRPGFPPDYSCPVVLEMAVTGVGKGGTGLSPAVVRRPRRFPHPHTRCWVGCTPPDRSHNPDAARRARLARRRFGQQPGSLATTTGRLLLPAATEMFQFAAFPPAKAGPLATPEGVAPFGDGRLNAWLPLPYPCAADRRPSSAGRAEASSVRASCLAWTPEFSTTLFCLVFTLFVGTHYKLCSMPDLLRCDWWSDGDSNPGHPACKAGALPTELPPQHKAQCALWVVGVPGLEPGTSILSGWRSNQLSYTPTPPTGAWPADV